MSGRGRGRPPRSGQEPAAAGPSRRSTRHQQQQEQQHEDEELDAASQQIQQDSDDQAVEQQRQPEALMSVPEYHQPIDPAITGSPDASMPPPPIPSVKNSRGQGGPNVARRGTRREVPPGSIGSINSAAVTDAFSSQQEPQNSLPQRSFALSALGALTSAASVASSEVDESPLRKAARVRLMNNMLPRLLTAVGDLYYLLYRDRGEDVDLWQMEREGLKAAFDTYRTHYVRDVSNPVIDPNFVAASMGLSRDSQAWDNTFRAIVAANLVSLLNDITPIHEENILAVLQQWDLWFLNVLFGVGPDIWDKPTKEAIIEQVLMIRTQLSIFTLQRLKDNSPVAFNPYEEVARIWCDGDVSVEVIQGFIRNDNDAPPFKPVMQADPEVDALLKDRTESRFRSICSLLPDYLVEGPNLDLSGLQGGYPLSEFDQEMRKFVRHCFNVVRPAAQQGPSVGQSLQFSHSDATSRADSQIRSQLETDAMAHQFGQAGPSAAPPSYNLETLRLLKQYEQQAPAGYGDSQQLSPIPPVPYPGDFNSPATVGYADPQLHPALAPNGALYAESAAQVSPGRKRRAQDATASGAPGAAKKSRVRRKKSDAPAPAAHPSAPSGPPAAPSQYPPLPPIPGTQDEPDYEALQQRTREISAAARKTREPQVRSPWVRKDVSQLVRAVAIYQAKWSTIQKEIAAGTIPFERPRDQQALRDKARLLKQDFLKADGVLPRGFDLVVLGKKEREAVIACGKNPDRKEADVDANNQPVNTEYRAEEVPAAPEPAAQLPPPQAQHEPQHDPQLEAQHAAQPEPQMEVPQAGVV